MLWIIYRYYTCTLCLGRILEKFSSERYILYLRSTKEKEKPGHRPIFRLSQNIKKHEYFFVITVTTSLYKIEVL